MNTPAESARAAARAGFARSGRVAALIEECHALELTLEITDFAVAGDPDEALLALLRLAEAHPDATRTVCADPEARERLIRVLGASRAMGDVAIRHPGVLAHLTGDPAALLARPVESSLGGAHDGQELRARYRQALFTIAVADLALADASRTPAVMRAISELVDATLRSALALARASHPEFDDIPLIVVAMGKSGGGELNYISDVDLVFVTDYVEGRNEEEAVAGATTLARALTELCVASFSGASGEPGLWPIDTNLRPEGRDGPLVRTLASHVNYYRRWAESWEFQALLKARPVAGEQELADRYLEQIWPLAFTAVERPGFVTDSQQMRRRVEASVAGAEADRHIKLGKGGLRDVEFTVQLLQLVHGRTDESLRVRGTIEAIHALRDGGYVSRENAGELISSYCLERTLEHRIQLHRMRRAHLLPRAEADLRRLARLLEVEDVTALWSAVRRRVRSLHESIFYRPLLPATAQLSADDVTLQPAAASDRLAAIGYLDPKGALHHIAALTTGISRRAAIQRHLLPVMLQWFADGPDPDGALLAFRRLSDTLGETHWYLKLLRDDNAVAHTLAQALSRSRYIGEDVPAVPNAVTWLAERDGLAARTASDLHAEAEAYFSRHAEASERALYLRLMRRRELLRAAFADVTEGVQTHRATAITDITDVALTWALRAARDDFATEHGREADALPVIVAMGRTGGREMTYASDADCVIIYEPTGPEASADATWVANRWRALLADADQAPGLAVDLALRPEGKSGAVTRTLDSYLDYVSRRAEPWERQALLRARLVTHQGLPAARVAQIREAIEAARYPEGGLPAADLRQISRLKARMEAERLPRGVPGTRHVKLGKGGLTDVEWAVQILQLRYGAQLAALRTTSTEEALAAARDAGLLTGGQAADLHAAWTMAGEIRAAASLALRRGGATVDVLPADPQERSLIAHLVGLGSLTLSDFDETWLRRARRARAVAEDLIYGDTPSP
ncbi:MAG: bifunctional [glutamine synthetase] adenylyltransferase/[glutamine synthetase]-adenylyl-L-tyrosine phosphorylase [Bowdeniella nasicola]|nr:bifunctional [glutamine synthetase] adenylyltransferase/[glutamine synthetase]-adenylyl-L-tyrosine phosphorylase [Bowdeniella nasicola]